MTRPKNASRHHVYFERGFYMHDDLSRSLRTHPLNIFPLIPSYHNQGSECLHAHINPPLKPSKDMIIGNLAMLGELSPNTPKLEALERTIEFYEGLTNGSADVGQRIAMNLAAQFEYIKKGIIQ